VFWLTVKERKVKSLLNDRRWLIGKATPMGKGAGIDEQDSFVVYVLSIRGENNYAQIEGNGQVRSIQVFDSQQTHRAGLLHGVLWTCYRQ
jgi:hypothetical protein